MDNSIFSPQTDSNMHHRGAWMELDGGTMGSTRTGRWGASSWTWRQFWGITNLAISKGISWWCFGGIDDPEKGTIFFWKRKVDHNFYLNRQIHISYPLWIHFFCNAIIVVDSPLGDRRSPETVSDQSLLLTEIVVLRFQWVACLSLLARAVRAANRHCRVPNWHLRCL